MNIVDVLQSGFGSGLARLARASLLLDPKDLELREAVRGALEELFKRDTPTRNKCLALSAMTLRSLPKKERPVGADMLVDLLAAACLARTQGRDEAYALVESWRQMLAPILAHHQEAGRALECSALLEDRARAALLREEAFELEMSFDVFASDVLDDSVATTIVKRLTPTAPVEKKIEAPLADERKLVLVVDDDDDIRETLGILLEGNGYQVMEAENGARAVAIIEQGVRPNLILLDLMMPVMSGWDFHKWQQGRSEGALPTIVFTATGLKQGSLGSLKILSKDVNPVVLLSEMLKVTGVPEVSLNA